MESTIPISKLIEQAEAKFTKEREAFIQARTEQEHTVNNFLERFMKLPEKYRANFTLVDSNTTYQSLFSALYDTPINEELYKTQFDAFFDFVTQVQELENTINKKAREVLTSYLND